MKYEKKSMENTIPYDKYTIYDTYQASNDYEDDK
jgi:hypothetical protein